MAWRDSQWPLETADPQRALSIGRGQLQPALESRPRCTVCACVQMYMHIIIIIIYIYYRYMCVCIWALKLIHVYMYYIVVRCCQAIYTRPC